MSQKVPLAGRLWAGLRSVLRVTWRLVWGVLRVLLIAFAAMGPGAPPPPPPPPQTIEARADDGEDEEP